MALKKSKEIIHFYDIHVLSAKMHHKAWKTWELEYFPNDITPWTHRTHYPSTLNYVWIYWLQLQQFMIKWTSTDLTAARLSDPPPQKGKKISWLELCPLLDLNDISWPFCTLVTSSAFQERGFDWLFPSSHRYCNLHRLTLIEDYLSFVKAILHILSLGRSENNSPVPKEWRANPARLFCYGWPEDPAWVKWKGCKCFDEIRERKRGRTSNEVEGEARWEKLNLADFFSWMVVLLLPLTSRPVWLKGLHQVSSDKADGQ